MFCPKCGGAIPPSESENPTCPSCGWQLSDGFLAHLQKPESNTISKETEKKESKPKHSNSKELSRLKITAIVLVCIVLFSGIASTIYYNSDSYKIKRAVDLIMNNEIDAGLALIENIDTPQANITKKYVEQVDRSKEDFLEAKAKGNKEVTHLKYKTLTKNFAEFKTNNADEIHYMPEGIKKKYDCIDSALIFIHKYISSGSPYQLNIFNCVYDAQLVMLNEVERKRSSENGSKYNLGVFQERINTSADALKTLKAFEESGFCIEVTDSAVISNCITSVANNKHYVYTRINFILDVLIQECSKEVVKFQEYIDETLEQNKDIDMDTPLFLASGTDTDYTAYVGQGLINIASDTHIYENQIEIIEFAERNIFYALIRG